MTTPGGPMAVKSRPHELVPKAMWVTLRLTGLTPLLLHNGEGADQLNPFQREIKNLTDRMKAKTISTEDAEEQKSWLQFQAALYWDKEMGLYFPGGNVFRSIMEGGSALGKLGTKVDAAVVDMDDQCAIEPYTSRYDDPRAIYDAGLIHRVPVAVGRSKVVSTRPRFEPMADRHQLRCADHGDAARAVRGVRRDGGPGQGDR